MNGVNKLKIFKKSAVGRKTIWQSSTSRSVNKTSQDMLDLVPQTENSS